MDWEHRGVARGGAEGRCTATYLALVVCAIWGVLEGSLQRALVVTASEQLPYLLGEALDVGGGDGRDGGGEGA